MNITSITQSAGAFFEHFRFEQTGFSPSSVVVPRLVALGAILAAGALWRWRVGRVGVVFQGRLDDVNKHARLFGKPLLHSAAEKGYKDVAEFLVKKGADLEERDSHEQTPLHLASFYGHHNVTEFLLTKGADFNAVDDFGFTPLHRAASYVHDQKAVCTELLLKTGADIKARSDNRLTPLHMAAFNGHIAAAEFLEKNGADIEEESSVGKTSLHLAAQYGSQKVAEFLFAKGADIEKKDGSKQTPLHLAASNYQDITAFLVDNGADLEAKDCNGQTVLHLLAQSRPGSKLDDVLLNILNKLNAKYILRQGIMKKNYPRPLFGIPTIMIREYVNQQDVDGAVALHMFVLRNNISAIKILLENGASLIPNKSGKTPLDVALERNRDEILEKFKTHTGYLRQTDENRKTPVQDAYEGRKHRAMEFFIEIEGRSPGVLYDSDRKLCIQYAGEADRRDLMRILSPSDHGHASALRSGSDAVAGFVPPVA